MSDTNATPSESNSLRRFYWLHIKPVSVPKECLRFTHTFGLGGTALALFTLLALTGILLCFSYRPDPARAYRSIVELYTRFRFGGLVRNIHYIAANLLFVVTLLHLCRVFFTGGFHGLRRVNWEVGIALFFLVMGACFTGYLLPWDQLAYWAAAVSTAMLGYVPLIGEKLLSLSRGGEMGASTLKLYFALHTSVIPLIVAVLLGYHFWRVRKAGGVVSPISSDRAETGDVERVKAEPHLAVRELGLGLAVVALVLITAVFGDAPLGEAANPGMSPNPSKAAWYFAAFQEMQLHLHPFFVVVVVPFTLAAFLVWIPYFKFEPPLSGPWFLTDKGRRLAGLAAVAAAVIVPAAVVLDDLLLRPQSGVPSIWTRGVFPFAAAIALLFGLRRSAVRRFSASGQEAASAVFVFVLISIAALTVIGVWFRGAGMALAPPWEVE